MFNKIKLKVMKYFITVGNKLDAINKMSDIYIFKCLGSL